MTSTGTALPVLMALRVKGRAAAAAVAAAAGISEEEARAAIDDACSRGAAGPSDRTESHSLTDAGRRELAALLAAEAVDRAALAALYERFLAADANLKARITEWQFLRPERRDGAATAPVRAAGTEALAVVEALQRLVPRLAPYARRLGAALGAARGNVRFVASPHVDSLHQVWFELHEDLLATLGRTRTP